MTPKLSKIKNQIDSITDNLNTPIDLVIKNAVIAFNDIALNTIASCEGHLDHGLPYPWIDLSPFSDDSPPLVQKRILIKKMFQSKIKIKLSEKRQLAKLEKTIEIKMAKYAQKVISLFDQFYQTTPISNPLRIITISYPEFIRIQPQSGCTQILLSQNRQTKMLGIFQKEFENLSNFLLTSHL